jgi:hypothetical protein
MSLAPSDNVKVNLYTIKGSDSSYKSTIHELYDIDPKIENTICQDTLLNPPNFTNKFILTNDCQFVGLS